MKTRDNIGKGIRADRRMISAFLVKVIFLLIVGIAAWHPARICAAEMFSNSTDPSKLNGTNWMSGINDDRLLSEINIPGTHDSATCWVKTAGTFSSLYDKYAKCQNEYIDDQLVHGIRYLDLRLSNECDGNDPMDDGKNLWLVHGDYQNVLFFKINGRFFCKNQRGQYISLQEVLEYIKRFLKDNPSETVIISVSKETGTKDMDGNELRKKVYGRVNEHLKSLYHQTNPSTGKSYLYTEDGKYGTFAKMPSLRQCRGQVVALSDDFLRMEAGSNYSGSFGSSSADADSSNAVMDIAGQTFYFENHYDKKKDIKLKWIQDIYRMYGGEKLPSDPKKRIGHGFLVQTSSNAWDDSQSPKEISDYVNPVIYSKEDPFFKKGYFYGWVLSDFMSSDFAKAVWITNYPDPDTHVHKMTVMPGEEASCVKDGRKTAYYCTVCKKYFADRDGDRELKDSRSLVIPKTGHVKSAPVRENVKDATSTEKGSYDDVVYCSVCKKELSRTRETIDEKSDNAVSYIDEHGTTRYCSKFTQFSSLEEHSGWGLADGWYVVKGVRTCDKNRLTVTGNANLILCDGAELTLKYGIRMMPGSSLTIWAQSAENNCGKLICGETAGSANAGIGGNKKETGGKLVLHGGNVVAKGGKYASGVGGGDAGTGGNVVVYGGTLTATGGDYGSGIGGGEDRSGGNLTVYGGTVIAAGGKKAAGIGGGYAGSQGGDVVIYGGRVTATGTISGAGIGGGEYARGGGCGGNVTIFGGVVTAAGAEGAAGIGGGLGGDQGGKVTISGGKVTARGGNNGAGIGGGYHKKTTGGKGGDVTISGGDVTAIGNNAGGGIGNGLGFVVCASKGHQGQRHVQYWEKTPFSGSFTMTGGTLLAGGGDARESMPNNESYDGYKAMKYGLSAAALKVASVSVADDLCLLSGDSAKGMSVVEAIQIVPKAQRSRYVRIRACSHRKSIFHISENGHTRVCANCNKRNSGEEAHTFNDKYECTVCGYKIEGNKIEFLPGEGAGSMDYAVSPRGKKYKLPTCGFTAPAGKTFSGWDVPGIGIRAAGQEIEVKDEIVKVTATWGQGFELWVGDKQVTYENCADILGDGTVSYDPAEKKLTLNGLKCISGTHEGALIYAHHLPLTICGTGTIQAKEGSADIGIHSSYNRLTIQSADAQNPDSTKITVNAKRYAIAARGVTLQSGYVKAVAEGIENTNTRCVGIHCYDGAPVEIGEGASCEVQGLSNSISADYSVQVNPGLCIQIIEENDGKQVRKAGMTSGGKIVYKENWKNTATHVVIEKHSVDSLKKVAEISASCMEDGVKVHYYCEVCGKMFQESNGVLSEKTEKDLKISALGHEFGKWTNTDSAEGTGQETDGAQTRTCRRCGLTENRVIPDEGIPCTFKKEAAKEATCEKPGNIEYWVMTENQAENAGQSGQQDNGQNSNQGNNEQNNESDSDKKTVYLREMTEEEKLISGVSDTGSSEQKKETRTISDNQDTSSIDESMEIMYVETEKNRWIWMLVIDPVETVIPALGHDWGEPVYTWADDHRSVTAKSVCGNDAAHQVSEKVTAGNGLTVKDASPSCKAPGERTITATFQNRLFSDQVIVEEIPVIDHTPASAVRENEVEATCLEDGSYDSVIYCSVCGKEISRNRLTEPKLGHDYDEWIVLYEPLPEEDGLRVRFCRHDPSHVEYEDIPFYDYDGYYCSQGDDSVWLRSNKDGLTFVFNYEPGQESEGGSDPSTSETDKLKLEKLILYELTDDAEDYDGNNSGTGEEGAENTGDRGIEIPVESYTSELDKDGRKVILRKEYLETLSPNTYLLTAVFQDDYADAVFTVTDVLWEDLVYNGEKQNLVSASAPASEPGSLVFALGDPDTEPDEEEYSSFIPEGRDAGTYYVWYKARRTSSENEDTITTADADAECIPVTIVEMPVTVSGIKADDKVYDGTKSADLDFSEVHLSPAPDIGGTQIPKIVEQDELFVTAEGLFEDPSVGDRKTVTISDLALVGEDASNYVLASEGQQTTATASIKPNELSITVSGYKGVYDGNAHSIDVSTEQEGVVITYKTGSEEFRPEKPVFVNAGTYTVSYMAQKEGCSTVTGTQKVTISRRKVTVKAADQTVDLTGSIAVSVGMATLEGAVEGHTLSKVTLTASDVNTATTGGKITPGAATIQDGNSVIVTANYSITYADGTLTVAKVPATVITKPSEITDLVYNGTMQELVRAGEAAGGTMQYAPGTEAEATGAYTDSIPKAGPAGTYYVWYKVKGDSNHTDSDPDIIKVTIEKAELKQVILSDTVLKYNGNSQTVRVLGVKGGSNGSLQVPLESCSLIYKKDNQNQIPFGQGTDAVAVTDQGTYTVTARALENGNFLGSCSAQFSIDSASVFTVSLIAEEGYTYDGTEKKPGVTVKSEGGDPLTENTDYKLEYFDNVDAGYGKVQVSGKGNYKGTRIHVFEIKKADSFITQDPVGNTGLTYNGANQALVTDGTATGGTLLYAVTDSAVSAIPDEGWQKSVPAMKNAGSYNVWYKVQGDANHNDCIPTDGSGTNRIPVTIARKEVAVSGIKAMDKVFDNTKAAVLDTSEVVFKGKVDADTLTVTASGTFEDAQTGTNKSVEITELTLGGEDAQNYQLAESSQKTASAGILPHQMEIDSTGFSGTYDGKAHRISVTAEEGVTVTYSESLYDDFSEYNPEYTDAGNHKVYFQGVKDGAVTILGEEEVRIEQAEPKVTAIPQASQGLVSDGAEKELVTAGQASGGEVWYALGADDKTPPDVTLFTADLPVGTDAGTYYVWYIVVGDENHFDLDPVCVTVGIQAEPGQAEETEKTEEPESEPSTPAETEPPAPAETEGPAQTEAPAPAPAETEAPAKTEAPAPAPAETEASAPAPVVAAQPVNEAMNGIRMSSNFLVTWKGRKVKVRWSAAPGADHYEIYAAYARTGQFRLVETVQSAGQFAFGKLNGKKLKTGKAVKVYVVAYRGVVPIGTTITGYVAGPKNRCTNVKRLRVRKKTFRLAPGRRAKIKVNAVRVNRQKKLLGARLCPKLRFISTNSGVASVNQKGVITAVGTGSCDILIYAQNGRGTRVAVAVG